MSSPRKHRDSPASPTSSLAKSTAAHHAHHDDDDDDDRKDAGRLAPTPPDPVTAIVDGRPAAVLGARGGVWGAGGVESALLRARVQDDECHCGEGTTSTATAGDKKSKGQQRNK